MRKNQATITFHIKYRCELCGQQDFYIMPKKRRTISNDIINSSTEFKIQCKNCGYECIMAVVKKNKE